MAHRLDLRQGLDFPRVARLLCRSVIDQVFIKGLPPPESCQSCFLRLPLAKFAPFVLAVVSADFTAQMPYRTFLGRHWPNSRQGPYPVRDLLVLFEFLRIPELGLATRVEMMAQSIAQ